MNITVTASRWKHGWELSLDGTVVTQVSTLEKAAQQVRDYLDTVEPDVDHNDWQITVVPQIGDLWERVTAARSATLQAQELQEKAARDSRIVARELRASGISVTDAAVILGVSRGRVSQLANS